MNLIQWFTLAATCTRGSAKPRHRAEAQAAKLTRFAAENEGQIRKIAAGDFSRLKREPACKPGSVEGNHSSGIRVATDL